MRRAAESVAAVVLVVALVGVLATQVAPEVLQQVGAFGPSAAAPGGAEACKPYIDDLETVTHQYGAALNKAMAGDDANAQEDLSQLFAMLPVEKFTADRDACAVALGLL